ncbi:TfuA-like protein [Streptomyces sp. NPDC003483]
MTPAGWPGPLRTRHQPCDIKRFLPRWAGWGVKAIGAASIGALRAAELAPFGMFGVGRIYTAYARGES